MADTGERVCGTVTGSGWSNLTNIQADDSNYARSGAMPPTSGGNYVSASNYGFTIPAGTINGFVHRVDHKGEDSNVCRENLKLTKVAGTGVGNDKWNRQNLTNLFVTNTEGSSTDLWGTTWTVAEVNASGFGATFQYYNAHASKGRYADVEYQCITVYYTPTVTGVFKLIDAINVTSLVQGKLANIVRWMEKLGLGLAPIQHSQSREGKLCLSI